MKNVLIVLSAIALTIGLIFVIYMLGAKIAGFRFEQWRQYIDYLEKVRI